MYVFSLSLQVQLSKMAFISSFLFMLTFCGVMYLNFWLNRYNVVS